MTENPHRLRWGGIQKPIVAEYTVMEAESPVAAEDYILETHNIEEEQYYIQSKMYFQDGTTFVEPDSLLREIRWWYSHIVYRERSIAQKIGFQNIESAIQNPKMSYLLEHYPLQEVVELDFNAVYHDPFEKIFGDDASSYLHKIHSTPSYKIFNQFEIRRKNQYYMKLIDELQKDTFDDGSPILPLNLALVMSYDETLDEKYTRELHMLKQREQALKGQ